MPPVRYIADLTGVRELALHGAADRGWWREHLAGEGLEPIEADGAAQVLVTGLDARWLLWPFRDLSVSVMARRSGSGETGLYFARAFKCVALHGFRFEVAPGCSDPVLAGLRASRFRGVCWRLRLDATHARSKTFRVRG